MGEEKTLNRTEGKMRSCNQASAHLPSSDIDPETTVNVLYFSSVSSFSISHLLWQTSPVSYSINKN